MKKILIGLFLLISSTAFADTLRVVKNSDYYIEHTYLKKYTDMKQVTLISPKGLDENEYMYYNGGIAYKVNGKRYWTSMFEAELKNDRN